MNIKINKNVINILFIITVIITIINYIVISSKESIKKEYDVHKNKIEFVRSNNFSFEDTLNNIINFNNVNVLKIEKNIDENLVYLNVEIMGDFNNSKMFLESVKKFQNFKAIVDIKYDKQEDTEKTNILVSFKA